MNVSNAKCDNIYFYEEKSAGECVVYREQSHI